jgi:DNA-binding NarL/FixJ family response regulator
MVLVRKEGFMTQAIRVFIVDDQRLFADAVAGLLSAQEEITLIGSTTKPDEAVEKIRAISVDVVLINAIMNRTEMVTLTNQIKTTRPLVKVIVLGLDHQAGDILRFIEAGAGAYILKDASFGELLQTIKAVHRGHTFCSPRIAASVFARIAELSRQRRQRDMFPEVRLTPREMQIYRLLAMGLTNKEIAQQLNISLSTTKNHVHNILEKFRVHYRHEAIRCGYENGLLKEPEPQQSSLGQD